MPHDKNGNLLEVGDEVIVRYKITAIQTGDDYCNVSATSVLGRKPDGQPEYFSGNAAVVEKVGS
jgi:hypothetical protein